MGNFQREIGVVLFDQQYVRPNERLQITDKAKSVLHRDVLAAANVFV
jgi:hypothetical protein